MAGEFHIGRTSPDLNTPPLDFKELYSLIQLDSLLSFQHSQWFWVEHAAIHDHLQLHIDLSKTPLISFQRRTENIDIIKTDMCIIVYP